MLVTLSSFSLHLKLDDNNIGTKWDKWRKTKKENGSINCVVSSSWNKRGHVWSDHQYLHLLLSPVHIETPLTTFFKYTLFNQKRIAFGVFTDLGLTFYKFLSLFNITLFKTGKPNLERHQVLSTGAMQAFPTRRKPRGRPTTCWRVNIVPFGLIMFTFLCNESLKNVMLSHYF